ncbi:MAG: amino acid permease [Kiritimatiellaeota bacterium]|nr:amino acid permease [Kiritimatiellota bacterium]
MPLRKELGFPTVFCIAVGAMISSGLFVLPGVLFGLVGSGVILVYLAASLLMAPAVLTKAELVSALPEAGGDYYFIDRSIGPTSGMLGGTATWAELSFKTAFALIGLAASFRLFFPDLSLLQVRLIAIGACVLFTVLNLCGTRHAGRLQIVLVVFLLTILGAYSIAGLSAGGLARLHPFREFRFENFFLATAMVFIAFAGLTQIASVAEEVKDPGHVLPRGILAAWFVVTIVYLVSVGATVAVTPPERLAGSLTPLALGAESLWGQAGRVLLLLAAVAAFVTTANAGILAASRVPLAMSRDGLLPPFLNRINERTGVPHFAVLFTSGFVCLLLLLDIELFVKAASAMKILLFAVTIVALILMRESGLSNYRPIFRSPGYPWLHGAGLIVYVLLLAELGTLPLALTAAILGGGLAWYRLYASRRVRRESALVHLAKRLANRDFARHDLEAELADVILRRDAPDQHRFDVLLRACPILDLPDEMTLDEFFDLASCELSNHLDVPASEIRRLLWERETSAPTVVRPGLAVPHLISPGRNRFKVLLARCKGGIRFSDTAPPVHAVFLLAGTDDERSFHLRALMAVAEIVQTPDFDRRWLDAPDSAALRRLVLELCRASVPA